MSRMDGFINILKPPGMTSHDVVDYIRRVCNVRKAGHAGTLDPDAAGVLLVCVGKATRLMEYIGDFSKSYRAEMVFGISTDTQDISGKTVKTGPAEVEESDFIRAINKFIGNITQIPPMVSAKKQKGIRLYELARKGIEVHREEIPVTIYDIKPVHFTRKRAVIDVRCSKGTYIRTLCHDIGINLGTVACLTVLIRTGIGPFGIADAVTLEKLKDAATSRDFSNIIKPLDYPLYQFQAIEIETENYKLFSNGRSIKINNLQNRHTILRDGQRVRLYHGGFFAIGRIENGLIKPEKLFK